MSATARRGANRIKMPKFMKLYKDKEKAKRKRYRERRENYEKGAFGNKLKEGSYFTQDEREMILHHILPDRALAEMFGSSTNGIQTMRWRLKNNYLNLYGSFTK